MNKISDSEFDIMEVLWQQEEPIQPSVLLKLMESEHSWNISTLNTLISRLAEKGFVQFTFKGRLKFVFYKISREEYGKKQAKSILRRLFGGSARNMVAALVDDRLNEKELSELDSLLKEYKEK